jgi:hypothetical protein
MCADLKMAQQHVEILKRLQTSLREPLHLEYQHKKFRKTSWSMNPDLKNQIPLQDSFHQKRTRMSSQKSLKIPTCLLKHLTTPVDLWRFLLRHYLQVIRVLPEIPAPVRELIYDVLTYHLERRGSQTLHDTHPTIHPKNQALLDLEPTRYASPCGNHTPLHHQEPTPGPVPAITPAEK